MLLFPFVWCSIFPFILQTLTFQREKKTVRSPKIVKRLKVRLSGGVSYEEKLINHES